MSRLGGILAGAIGGGAQAVGEMSRGYIEDERRVNLERERSQIEEQRQMRLEEARRRGARDDKTWELTEGRRMSRDADVSDIEAKTPAEVKRARELSKVEVDTAGAMPFTLGEGTTRYKDGKPVASKGKTYAPGTAETAELARFKLQDAQEIRKLTNEWETATPERRKQIDERLRFLRGDKSEFDVEKVTETRFDDEGNEIKTERTQRRRPPPSEGGGAAPANRPPLKNFDMSKGGAPSSPEDGGASNRSGEAAGSSIEMADSRTLRRIADIPGHKDQQAAQAELKRRNEASTR